MTVLKSLLLAIDLATSKRDQALAQLQKTMQAHAFAQDQMQQLQQYAQETEQRWLQNAQRSTTPELLHHHYQFMNRLNQAIGLQDGVLAGSSQRVDTAKQVVLQAEFRLASLQQVLAGRQADQAKTQQRREQKQMDEFAALQTQRQIRMQTESPS
ncbi:flagellar export protein FliJ [Rhodoferax sp.]|uniref:flagellar export protein FliJ n=1 Tax=Rhodoferax sp. TaxID=50421 RepID=UPI00260DB260|nr:flagellar export protein FliJ [Rhodoferax sp.]MDD2925552.1 flagellar export protein FliJ [Rhodoferax sp.]